MIKEIYLLEVIDEISMGPFGSNIKIDNFIPIGIPVLNGRNLAAKKLVEKEFNFISEEKANNLGKANAKKGDVVITHRGTLGQVSYIPNDAKYNRYVISQSQFRVRFKKEINPIYITYLFHTAYGQKKLLSFKNHVGVPALAQATSNFKCLKLNMHDKVNQDKIAYVLSALDDRIELNNKINAELEAMAKTLHNYWFVQFDFPNKNGKPYRSSGGKMVWNDELKRDIPDGWKMVKMAEWINIGKSGDWGKEEPEGNFTKKVMCFRGADINGLNGIAELKPPVRYILETNSFKILESHDVIIEISGGSPIQSTGRLAFITDSTIKRFEYPLICSNFCKPISLKNKKLLYNFVFYWNSLYDNNIFFDYEGKTSGIKNLLFDSFINSYYTVLPDEKIANQFYDLMTTIQNKKQIALAENQKISGLLDWLLPMLMNGQVSVGANHNQQDKVLSQATELDVEDKIISRLYIPKGKSGFAKQVLAGKIVSLFKEDKHFTHIKFQKLQFLAEHIAEADLNLNYYFQAAGPCDNRFMHTIANSFRKSKWFDEKKYKFIPLTNHDQIDIYYEEYFSPVSNQLDRLFKLLTDTTVADTEIIATIYAVWNNRILLKQPVAESLLIEDFYNWSDRKHQYTQKQILQAVKWLRKNKFTPKGFGKEIKRAQSK